MKKFVKNLFFSFILVLGMVLVVSCRETTTPTGGQPTDTHEHVVDSETWYRDSALHWKECSLCDEQLEADTHTMGEYVQSTTECVKTSECTVCGFTKIKKNEHNYVDEKCTVCGKYEYDIEVVQYYVRGTAVGTWDAVEDNALVLDESDYSASITVYMAKDTQFKIADAKWTDGYNFGYGNAAVQYDEGLFGNNDGDNFLVLTSADYIITVKGLDTETHTVVIKPSCIHNFGAPKLQDGKTCDYVVSCSKCGLENKYTEHYFEDDDLICDLCGHYDFKEYYVKGSFNGFAANRDFKLDYDETTYTATIDLLLTVGHVFKIGTAEGWEFSFDANTIPVGAFVADADNNYMCVASTPAGEDVLFHVTISNMNTINQKIEITTDEEYVVNAVEGTVNASDLYVRGSFTGEDWPAVDDYRLSISNGIASITLDLAVGDIFKVASSDWSTEYHLKSINVNEGLFEAAGDDASKPNLKVLVAGTYKIEVKEGKCSIILVSEVECTSPNGEHTWVDATCTTPKTCSTCQFKDGQPLDHSWDEGTVSGDDTIYKCTRTGCQETKTVSAASGNKIFIYFDIDWENVSDVYLNGVKMNPENDGGDCEFMLIVEAESITTLDLDFEQNGAWFHVVDQNSTNFVESSTMSVSMEAGKSYIISGVTWRHDNNATEKFFSVKVSELR